MKNKRKIKMKMHTSTIFIALHLIIAISILQAQDKFNAQNNQLYTPREVLKAYKAQTRSITGLPGKQYWQNRSEYNITAEIDTTRKALIGSETIRYFNNSPDTLDKIILRLYQDIYRYGNPRDYDFPKSDLNDGMVISSLSLGGKEIVQIDSLERYGTNLHIPLQKKLLPGRNLMISVQWSYKFATEFLIMGSGKSEGNNYFVSYWYPQVAVYDDISGWDDYEYKGMVEFYNDFSDYDVTIKVPNDFIVWSTGVLQNPWEVLSEKYAVRYQKALASDDIVSIVGLGDQKAGNITIKNGKNIWHYKADDVPDFTFGTSDRYLWDMTSLIVDKTTKRRATLNAVYDNTSKHFYRVAEFGRRTIEYLSDQLPGIPYPFPSMTIFQGTFAMEYPMMVNIRVYREKQEWLFINTVIHEIVHTYFPFYMGTNERKYGFMDEGWAHMLPMEIQTVEMNKVLRNKIDARTFNNIWNYEEEAGTEKYDRPPAVLSIGVDGGSSHVSNHNRPGAAYYFLQDLLGKDLFKKALLEFMRRWHHKHPVPSDFFNTFNEAVCENLSWYWKPWFFEFGYPDLTIKKEDIDANNRTVLIQKSGNIPIPINLTVIFEDSSEINIYKTARAWQAGNTSYSISIPGNKPIAKIVLGDNIIPDVDRSDNFINVEK